MAIKYGRPIEARLAPLDDAGRRSLKEIHERSVHELEGILSDDLRKELADVTLPFTSDTPRFHGRMEPMGRITASVPPPMSTSSTASVVDGAKARTAASFREIVVGASFRVRRSPSEET